MVLVRDTNSVKMGRRDCMSSEVWWLLLLLLLLGLCVALVVLVAEVDVRGE